MKSLEAELAANELQLPALPCGGKLVHLDPEKLASATERAIGELLEQGESANTRTSYQSAARYWIAWFELRYRRDFDPAVNLPLPLATVLQFIADHADRLDKEGKELKHELPAEVDAELISAGVKRKPGAMSLNTLEHRMAAMVRLHRSRHLDSPTDHEEVRRLMRAVRSAHARRGQLARGADPLHADHLQRLLDTCDDSPLGVRDRALLYFGFASGGRRRSEIVGADLALLRPDGADYTYNLAFSKTNQTGTDLPENHKPILGEAAEALREWLQLLARAGISDGPIFRRIRRGGHIQLAPLSESGMWDIVKERCKKAGLAAEGRFSPHSLRSGFLTEAGRQGVPLKEAMAFSGHRDVKTAMRYVRPSEMKLSKAANLLGSRKAQGS